MKEENINIAQRKPRVLIAPLDWGLGHATRMVPLLQLLENAGAEVILAADGAIRKLLQKELPGREILPLSGYNIRYGKSNKTFFMKLLLQIPSVLQSVKKEQAWLKQAIAKNRIDAVISDNRFGLYSKKIPTVFITHQLFIEAGNSFLNRAAQKINFSLIHKFSECWVPDWAQNGLAGRLSHPVKMPPLPVKYLGPLSRFEKAESTGSEHLLFILSGPEPMRSIWEKELLAQLKSHQGHAVMVRGLPVSNEKINAPAGLTVHDFLPAAQLSEEIAKAGTIICRSGYSTIMDLAVMGKKAILVPTPGQGEQEYLGRYLMEQGWFYSCGQDQFRLDKALQAAQKFSFNRMPAQSTSGAKSIVEEWVRAVQKIMPLQ